MEAQGIHDKLEETCHAVQHPDLETIQGLIAETSDARCAISICGRGGRIIATLVSYKEDGSFAGVNEFSSAAKTTAEELHDIVGTIRRYIDETKKQEGGVARND